MNQTNDTAPPEDSRLLAVLFLAPTVWAVHFVLCYATASVWCARYAGESGSLGPVRIAIAVYTLVALIAIGFIGVHGFRRHRLMKSPPPHDTDTAEDRHRFLGFATMLLAGLSMIATIYVASAALFVGTCR